MGQGFKGVLGIGVSLPFHFILQLTIDDSLANNAFNSVLGVTIDNLDRGRSRIITGKRK